MAIWIWIYACFLASCLFVANKKNKESREMKPRLLISPEDFLDLVSCSGERVIWRKGGRFVPHKYVCTLGDYIYWTQSKTALTIEKAEIQQVQLIVM